MNPDCGTTNGSDDKIIITPHLITNHLISTIGCNFTQLSDPIGSNKIQLSILMIWTVDKKFFEKKNKNNIT
jgi:hypothetical protein